MCANSLKYALKFVLIAKRYWIKPTKIKRQNTQPPPNHLLTNGKSLSTRMFCFFYDPVSSKCVFGKDFWQRNRFMRWAKTNSRGNVKTLAPRYLLVRHIIYI